MAISDAKHPTRHSGGDRNPESPISESLVTSQRIGITHAVRLGLILSLSLLWFFSNSEQALACSCVRPEGPSEELAQSAAVFTGRVISLREFHDPNAKAISSTDPTTVEFEVDTVWKGPSHETAYFTTARSEASCGFTFVEGKEYIVYSHDGSTVILCSRTALLENAETDLAELGEGDTPQPGTIGTTPVVTPPPVVNPEVMVPTAITKSIPVQQAAETPPSQPTLSSTAEPIMTHSPEPKQDTTPSGGGCSLSTHPGSSSADAAWLAIMAGLVCFGTRRRPRRQNHAPPNSSNTHL